MEIIRAKSELPNILSNPQEVEETARQFQKDFLMYSILFYEEDEEMPTSWEQLFNHLYPIVEHLAEKDNRRLVQLFYRMDLSEKLLLESMNRDTIEQSIAEICVMMIHREWMKVHFRKKYS